MGKAKKLAAPRPNPLTFQEGVDEVIAEPLVLIVVPTRELAVQIFNEARKFCYRTMLRPCVVYGGVPTRQQSSLLTKGCDVLIGTPGRLTDFIQRPHVLTLRRLKYMILDEADEMLNQDWGEALDMILNGGGKISPALLLYLLTRVMQNKMSVTSSLGSSLPHSPRVPAIWPSNTSPPLTSDSE